MKYEWIDEYLLKMPGVTKDLQKDWNWIRYQIGGKMFAAICLDDNNKRSNQAKAGMNPKTLQYLRGHSDISVTMNVYRHIGFDDAEEELKRMEEFRKAQAEVEKKNEKPMSQKMFKAILVIINKIWLVNEGSF